MTDNTTPAQDLRSALEPFALEAANYDDNDGEPDYLNAPDGSRLDEFHDLTVGQLRAARKAWYSSGHAIAENAKGGEVQHGDRMAARYLMQCASAGKLTEDEATRIIGHRRNQASPTQPAKGGEVVADADEEALRLAYVTGYNDAYFDTTDGMVDHNAAEEGWGQYQENLAAAAHPPAALDEKDK